MSFGGPAAHLGYFRQEFVVRRKWIDESTLGELIALTQLLPGPASSQTGFLIGIVVGGIPGGVAAWAGFTLPSAVLMTLFAAGVGFARGAVVAGALHGLQVAAIAVVANAVLSMSGRLCPDWLRRALAVAAAAFVLWQAGPWAQIATIVTGGAIGRVWLRLPEQESADNAPLPVSKRAAGIALAAFAAAGAIFAWSGSKLLFAIFRTGALVFGGGHVVLPLLEQAVVRPGWVAERTFLAGYGAAQTMPGPLFTFSAYLGFASRLQPNGIAGAGLCLLAIFLPGLLLAVAVAPFWHGLRGTRRAREVLAGVNASVVGLLLAALVHAARAGALRGWVDFLVAVTAFAALARTRASPVAVVLFSALLGAGLAMIG